MNYAPINMKFSPICSRWISAGYTRLTDFCFSILSKSCIVPKNVDFYSTEIYLKQNSKIETSFESILPKVSYKLVHKYFSNYRNYSPSILFRKFTVCWWQKIWNYGYVRPALRECGGRILGDFLKTNVQIVPDVSAHTWNFLLQNLLYLHDIFLSNLLGLTSRL